MHSHYIYSIFIVVLCLCFSPNTGIHVRNYCNTDGLWTNLFKKNKFRILILKKIGNRQNELKKTDFADPLPPSVVNTRSETCGAWTPPNIPKFEFFKPYVQIKCWFVTIMSQFYKFCRNCKFRYFSNFCHSEIYPVALGASKKRYSANILRFGKSSL